MNKILVVCGDSFHSITNMKVNTAIGLVDLSGSHYSELLAKKLNYDLVNLAIPGSSLSLLAIQILEAINLNPSLIIIGPTPGIGQRIEYIEPDKGNAFDLEGNNLGLFYYGIREHPYTKLNLYKIGVVKTGSILDIPMLEYKEQLLKYFPTSIKQKYDEFSFLYAFRELVDSKINFLIFSKALAWDQYYEENFLNYVLKYSSYDNLIKKEEFDFADYYDQEVDRKLGIPYHTLPEVQITLANYLELRIRNQFNV